MGAFQSEKFTRKSIGMKANVDQILPLELLSQFYFGEITTTSGISSVMKNLLISRIRPASIESKIQSLIQ